MYWSVVTLEYLVATVHNLIVVSPPCLLSLLSNDVACYSFLVAILPHQYSLRCFSTYLLNIRLSAKNSDCVSLFVKHFETSRGLSNPISPRQHIYEQLLLVSNLHKETVIFIKRNMRIYIESISTRDRQVL